MAKDKEQTFADGVQKMAEKLKTYYTNVNGATSPALTVYHIEQIEKEILEGLNDAE